MKARDLQIGDWVQARILLLSGDERMTPPMRVVEIGQTWVCLAIDPEQGDPVEYELAEIEPVPLTGDILRANGWKWTSTSRAINRGDDWRVVIDIIRKGRLFIEACMLDHSVHIPIDCYVHELQHALQLAGIDKDIFVYE